MSIKYKDGLQ